MPAISHEFGSKAWADQMFSDPPARKVKGRTRWTHRHATWVEALGRLAYVESRNELIGLLALEYLCRRGLIKRFKEQPFACDETFAGSEYTPDLAAEGAAGVTYVIEIKTKRFLTRAMEKDFERLKEKFAEVGMKFLLWTDHDPLIQPLRHNLLQLRRASSEHVSPDETARLIGLLTSEGSMSLRALYEDGLDLTLISHAAWNGQVFLPLLDRLHDATPVGVRPFEDLGASLLAAEPDLHRWWNSLEAAA